MLPFSRLTRIWDYLLSGWGDRHGERARRPIAKPHTRLQLTTLEDRLVPTADVLVNTYTSGAQGVAEIASDPAGDFVAVWESYGQDGSSDGIYAQRYTSGGTPAGSEFRVNTYTTGAQRAPAVAMDADGDFVVTWESSAQDGNLWGIYAQRYSSNGTPQGSEFLVNTFTTGNQQRSSVAMDSTGNFVVAWDSDLHDGGLYGVYAQRYAANGTAQGSEFLVNTHTTNSQSSPSIAMDSDGDFVIAWESGAQDGDGVGVYAQRYAASGSTQGSEFLVNTYTTGDQMAASVAMDAMGNFVVAWDSFPQDGDLLGTYAQRYSANGSPLGSEFQVNTYTTGTQGTPAVGMSAGGDFVVAWRSDGQDGSGSGIYAQRYLASGAPQGSEFLVNDYTANDQSHPAVAVDAEGNVIVVWSGAGTGDAGGVYLAGSSYVIDDQTPSLFAPPTDCGCGCPTNLVETPEGADTNAPDPNSANPVRYADGAARIVSYDLASGGSGLPWGQTRMWSNAPGYATGQSTGTGWVGSQVPRLLQVSGTSTLAVVGDAQSAWFFDLSGSSYVERFAGTETLTYNSGSDTYTFTTGTGNIITFGGFSNALAKRRGQFESMTTSAGQSASVTSWNADGSIAEVQTANGSEIESYLYTYATGVNAGLVSSVTHRRSTNSGSSWSTVESVDYVYYDGTGSGGNARDLQSATIKDGSAAVISTDYYRYYMAGETNGYQHGLKYVVSGSSYDLLRESLGGTDAAVRAASDTTIATYANNYFEYDSSRRVTKEVASGAGCSVCSGGLGTTTFSYTSSANSPGTNSWAMKTVETLQDGNTNTVYTNSQGDVMLSVYTDTTTSEQWINYYEYDSAGRVILEAAPSAVTGYNDSYADLVHFVSGNAQYLNDSAGLILARTYGSSTTAMAGTPGDVAGYLKQIDIQQGETGTAVPQESMDYFLRSVSAGDFYHVASDTVYRNDNGTGGETTSYAYTFASGTDQITAVTTTLPTVTTAQNGSNSANSMTTVFDTMGRPIWSKDEAGFITYVEYDAQTGAIVKTIEDVDTTQTGTFSNLPSGWSTPGGGGLHLTTTYEVDTFGRVTKETTPEGRVNYAVYNDANHEVRTYMGWNSSTNLPTGPTMVTRGDWANGYTETLTMTATPNVSSGRPTGTESIASVQSLSRSYVNAAGQVVATDSYFDLSGLTYSTSTSLGAAGVNFYRTEYAYDTDGNLCKVTSPEGTIYRTVFDGQGRPISDWVGTDDTPTTGSWSPSNLTGTNMVEVQEYEYDGGSVGNSNLTKVTEHPGGGAADRVTQTWFDWRDRPVAVKEGVEGSESTSVNRPLYYTDYDNLGEATKVRMYDADTVTPTVTSGVPQPLSSSLLRAQTTTSFDELGRVYRTDTFSVNPSSGAVSTNSLHTDIWYDSRGNVIKTASPNGLVEKMVYDGVNRVTTDYLSDGGGDTGYSDASTVTGDTVVEQTELTYDKDSNVKATTHRERFHNASGTGALGSPSSGIGARVSYTGMYYDLSNRPTAVVDVGTNGGSAWSPLPPTSVPSRSSTTLVTSFDYAADAVQTVQLTGSPTGGTFTLTFGGQTTSGIAYNASAAIVQTAIEALSSVGTGNAIVTAAPGGGWQIRFAGTLAAAYQVKLTASGAGLTGGSSPAVAISTLSAGGDAGGVAAVTDPSGIVSRTYADALGRATQTVEDFTTGAMTDTSNITTNFSYNSVGLTSLSAALSGGGVQTTAYVYGVTQAGGNGIDSNDVVAATQHPDPSTGLPSGSEQESVKVNALGDVLTSTDRNGSIHTLTYDVLGRVVSDAVTTLGSGVDGSVRRIEYAYDVHGNLQKATSYDASSGGSIVNQVLRDFNGFGQMITEWQSHSGAVVTGTSPKVQYAFNFNGSGSVNQNRQTSMTYPSGYVLTYNYSSGLNSAISRLSSLSDSTGTLESYDFLGLGTVVRRAHTQPGVDLTYIKQSGESDGSAGDQYSGLDSFGRVVDQRWIKTSSGTATDRFQYGYDENSNALYRDNLVNSAYGELYTYDNLNQLTTFDRGTLNGTKTGLTGSASRSQSWDYDAAGNWDSVTTGGSTQTRSANAQNEITSVSGATTPTYDSNGNMTTDETGRQFVYDAWNRLVTVKNSGGTTLESFAYDALNRRVTRTSGGTTTDLYYSNNWQVLEERVSGTATTRYVWSPVYVDAMVLRDRDTDANGTLDERLWVQQDANWNVTALVDGSGVVVERYLYDAFGVQTVFDASYSSRGSSSYAWEYGFQGLRFDATSGLSEARMRWYSPTLGRWVSIDPIRFAAGDVNLYRMEGNGPTDGLDPMGLQEKQPLPKFVKMPSCMDCHADPDILNGSKRLGDLSPTQLNTIQRWNAGNYSQGYKNIWQDYQDWTKSNRDRMGPWASDPQFGNPKTRPPKDMPLWALPLHVAMAGSQMPSAGMIRVPTGVIRVPTGPIKAGEVTTFKDFVKRSTVGDKLEGHEIWQHANLKANNLATTRCSTVASQNNPVLALERSVHQQVNSAQRALDAAGQTPLANIRANAKILRDLKAAPEATINALEKQAIEHAKSLGFTQ